MNDRYYMQSSSHSAYLYKVHKSRVYFKNSGSRSSGWMRSYIRVKHIKELKFKEISESDVMLEML